MNTPISREQLLRLIPHAGAMCLLDEVTEYSESEIRCISRSHRDPANPLRRGAELPAIHLVEYAAQAMAAHGALASGAQARPGMLAALRDIRLHVERIHDVEGELQVHARRRVAQRDGLLYEFSICGGGRVLCEGRIAIALQ